MNVYTSYFYQIRFFKPNMIPLSTAVWDPKWYHNFEDQGHKFLDKRGVINGLRVPAMAPGYKCQDLCRGPENPQNGCSGDPTTCQFLSVYRKQLDDIDCDDYMRRVQNLLNQCKRRMNLLEEPIAVFIVHEAPTKACSERGVIQEWCTSHGYPCTELTYPIQ